MVARLQQIEARVLHLVEQVLAGRRIEDNRVECKSTWPGDHRRAARQIGGLANAAGGDDVLWLVGLDEDGGRVVDPGATEVADWWQRVSRYFAEVAPEVTTLSVPVPGGGVVSVLLFQTVRSPYVVTTNGAGGVDREIPWRAGNATRSAHRSEILRSVVQEAEAPQLDLVSAFVRAEVNGAEGVGLQIGALILTISMAIYVEAAEPVRLPEHRWAFEVVLSDGTVLPFKPTVAGPTKYVGSTGGVFPQAIHEPVGGIAYVPASGLQVTGSDRVSVECQLVVDQVDPRVVALVHRAQRLSVRARLPLALSSRSARLDVALSRARRAGLYRSLGPRDHDQDLRIAESTHDGLPGGDLYGGVAVLPSHLERMGVSNPSELRRLIPRSSDDGDG